MKQIDVQSTALGQNMSPTAMGSYPSAPNIQQGQSLDKENFLATLPDLNEEPTHARGGHGIFGQPKV